MEVMNEEEKIIGELDKVVADKKFFRFYSLINKLSISNYLFAHKELIHKENRKKSHDFSSKRTNINDMNIIIPPKKKFTRENISLIKRFVPKLKPIKNKVIPSKLFLNHKDEKISKDPIKNYLSFSNSGNQEKKFYSTTENWSFQNKKNTNFNKATTNIIKKQNTINVIRNYLIDNKSKYIKKYSSSGNLKIIKKSKNKELNDSFNSFDSDLNDEEYNNYMALRGELTNKNDNNNDNFKTRTNSMSILNLLEKQFQRKEE